MTLEAEGEKVREFELDGKDIFILDMAGLAVYEWVGDDCSNEEKGMSLKLAVDYCKSIGKPRANICRVHQGHEHEEFWSDYRVWLKIIIRIIKSLNLYGKFTNINW